MDFTYGVWANAIPLGAPVSLTLSCAPPITQILVDPRMYNADGEDLASILSRDAGDMRAYVQAPGNNSGFRWNGTPFQAVPEPATVALVTSGLSAVAVRRRLLQRARVVIAHSMRAFNALATRTYSS